MLFQCVDLSQMQMSEQAFRLSDLTHNMADLSEQYIARGGKTKMTLPLDLNGIGRGRWCMFHVCGREKVLSSVVSVWVWEVADGLKGHSCSSYSSSWSLWWHTDRQISVHQQAAGKTVSSSEKNYSAPSALRFTGLWRHAELAGMLWRVVSGRDVVIMANKLRLQ